MAASAIPAPGTKYGPCVDVNCVHRDCDASRKSAACVCHFCDEPIGYDQRAFDEWSEQVKPTGRYDYHIHKLCYLRSIGRA